MSKLLTAGQTLQTVEALRQTIEETVEKHQACLQEEAEEREASERRLGLLKKKYQEQLAADRQRQTETRQAREARLQRWSELRQARIHRARQRSEEALKQSVEQQRDQRKYLNQKQLLQANRECDGERTVAERALSDYLERLTQEEDRHAELQSQAERLFAGYYWFLAKLKRERQSEPGLSKAVERVAGLKRLQAAAERTELGLGQLSGNGLVRIFSWVRLWFWLLGIMAVGGTWYGFFSGERLALLVSAGGGVAVLSAYGLGLATGRRKAGEITDNLHAGADLLVSCRASACREFETEVQRVDRRLREIEDRLEQEWQATDEEAEVRWQVGVDEFVRRHGSLLDRHKRNETRAIDRLARISEGPGESARELSRIEAEESEQAEELTRKYRQKTGELADDYRHRSELLLTRLEESRAAALELLPGWDSLDSDQWQPPQGGDAASRFASLRLDLDRLASRSGGDSPLVRHETTQLTAPLALKIPEGESVLFETEGIAEGPVVTALNGILLRLLTTSPVGRLAMTIFDPVGMGKIFSGWMHLSDHDEQMIGRRIWTEAGQLDNCLQDLTVHMEKVTQMYLRNEYPTLADYNREAGDLAEKYRFLVVADFPARFSETALGQLQSLALNGPRCGVFLIIHRDLRTPLAVEPVGETLRQRCFWLRLKGDGCELGGKRQPGVGLHWDPAPDPELSIALMTRAGQLHAQGGKVEIPFEAVAPPPEEIWTRATGDVLSVPIGRASTSRLQYLTLGQGLQQHALIVGKTGSGKSTLFHAIVVNLALRCRPDEIEFYLIDFKKGVEFKCYAKHRLPHARVVAIESDREFGLSVLERVDAELRRRGELFRQHNSRDLNHYRESSGEPLPRTLLLIDEFQEFFVEDDAGAQRAAVLLDRIARQGRAFGIHAVLGSQTLGGVYTLGRATFAQMNVRIALQCDEADAILVMDEDNTAPRLLSRPGEGIYNSEGGALAANSPFQTVWLSDRERDLRLEQLAGLAQEQGVSTPGPVIFEGNAPANLADNPELAAALQGQMPASGAVAWLGAPNMIKGHTEAVFEAQGGSNLLIVGQNGEMSLSLLLSGMISLAASSPAGSARFIVLDPFLENSRQRTLIDRALAVFPHPVQTLNATNPDDLLRELSKELAERETERRNRPAVYLVIFALASFRQLRAEDEFALLDEEPGQESTGAIFDRLVREGSSRSIHVLAALDTYGDVQRCLTRRALPYFEMRVLLQMSANDSAALIDGSQANALGLYRALYCHERKGWTEIFRPYTLPSEAWLAEAETLLAGRAAAAGSS